MNGNRQQSRLPKQYKGALTPEKAVIGIKAAMTNAVLLLKDAELLLESKRWQRAKAFAILAIEETG